MQYKVILGCLRPFFFFQVTAGGVSEGIFFILKLPRNCILGSKKGEKTLYFIIYHCTGGGEGGQEGLKNVKIFFEGVP